MKTAGIVRNLDNLGRVVIPKEMRNLLGINEGEPVEIAKVNNDIVIRKYSRGCIFCGSDERIVGFKETLVCEKCKQALKED